VGDEPAEYRAKVTSKGQITIPQKVRERLGLRPGDELVFREESGRFEIRRPPVDWSRWAGTVDLDGLSVDEWIREMRGE
jgi:antitoxin PrlF